MKKTIYTVALAFVAAAASAFAEAPSEAQLLYNGSGKLLGTALSTSSQNMDVSTAMPNKDFSYTLFFSVEDVVKVLSPADAVSDLGEVCLVDFRTSASAEGYRSSAWTLVADSTGFRLRASATGVADLYSTYVDAPTSWTDVTELALTVNFHTSGASYATSLLLTTAVQGEDAVAATYSTTESEVKQAPGASSAWNFNQKYHPSSISLNTTYVDAAYVTANGIQAGDSSLTYATNLMAHYDAAVPEPATATLSLLALAGLAARRRRQ